MLEQGIWLHSYFNGKSLQYFNQLMELDLSFKRSAQLLCEEWIIGKQEWTQGHQCAGCYSGPVDTTKEIRRRGNTGSDGEEYSGVTVIRTCAVCGG